MNRYDLLSSKLLSEKDYSVKLNDIEYDKVVDDSKFLIDSENCRQAVFSPQGSSSLPQYDDDNIPSDFIVKMRQKHKLWINKRRVSW